MHLDPGMRLSFSCYCHSVFHNFLFTWCEIKTTKDRKQLSCWWYKEIVTSTVIGTQIHLLNQTKRWLLLCKWKKLYKCLPAYIYYYKSAWWHHFHNALLTTNDIFYKLYTKMALSTEDTSRQAFSPDPSSRLKGSGVQTKEGERGSTGGEVTISETHLTLSTADGHELYHASKCVIKTRVYDGFLRDTNNISALIGT